jgi:hypothetical protein
MNAPPCPNFPRDGCSQSNTFVSRETDDAYVIQCRTCKAINVWPKDKAEKAGKYEADLKRQLLKNQAEEQFRRKRQYSLPGGR